MLGFQRSYFGLVTTDEIDDSSYSRDDDPTAEIEDDLAVPESGSLHQAVVTGTDWTVGTILEQLRRDRIQLNPRFQRRDAWRAQRKSEFIESLFLGLPIPQIVLAEVQGTPGRFIVIDGKQRLLALRQFAATKADYSADDPDSYKPLVLSKLKVREDLNKKTLETLRNSDPDSDDLAAFENQTIRAVVLRHWPNEEFLFRVFYRLNSGSVSLSPQELRQALHPGPFLDYVLERSESEAIRRVLNLARPDFRMRDVELLIRFYAFANFLPTYAGELKPFLDVTCQRLNAQWPDREAEIRQQSDFCDAAITAAFDVFGQHAFRRWTGKWETQFNRAVFDSVVYYFRNPFVAAASIGRKDAVVAAYKSLSERDENFADAIQFTTKTIPATAYRLSAWGDALAEVLGSSASVAVPRLEGERIVEKNG